MASYADIWARHWAAHNLSEEFSSHPSSKDISGMAEIFERAKMEPTTDRTLFLQGFQFQNPSWVWPLSRAFKPWHLLIFKAIVWTYDCVRKRKKKVKGQKYVKLPHKWRHFCFNFNTIITLLLLQIIIKTHIILGLRAKRKMFFLACILETERYFHFTRQQQCSKHIKSSQKQVDRGHRWFFFLCFMESVGVSVTFTSMWKQTWWWNRQLQKDKCQED